MRPLVFVHGFLGAPQMWRDVLAMTEHDGPVESLLLPGHGQAPWFSTGETFDSAVDAVALRIPEGEPAILVGYSMGARIALGIAARHPARVAGLVLVGFDPGLPTEEERRARAAWDDAQARAIEESGLPRFVEVWSALPIFASQAALPPSVREARRQERLGHTTRGLSWAMRVLGLGRMPPRWDALATIAAPLHLVTGEEDEKFTALSRRVLEKVSSATHSVIPHVGHDVALEAPRALAREIRKVTKGNTP